MPFGNLMVAVDGSQASQEALEQAVWLARQGRTTLTGFFVIDAGWADFVGNDWQSSRNARPGFLDYIASEQYAQAEAARRQSEAAAEELDDAPFSVLAGDPVAVLLEQLNDPRTGLLIFGRRTFQVSGRPSLKDAAQSLAKNARRPVLVLP